MIWQSDQAPGYFRVDILFTGSLDLMFSLYAYVWSYKPVNSPKVALKSLTKSEIRKSLKTGDA